MVEFTVMASIEHGDLIVRDPSFYYFLQAKSERARKHKLIFEYEDLPENAICKVTNVSSGWAEELVKEWLRHPVPITLRD